jgi:UDP-N-acetylglucosamine 2-epimerase (non-hydrolysing)
MTLTTSIDKLRNINIVGARPNFMKIAPLMAEYCNFSDIEAFLVHIGQHYDAKMSHFFFDQQEIPKPQVDLEVGSASQAVQPADIIKRFEPLVQKYHPDLFWVVGDVTSAIACALVAVKLGVQVAHVEAGLRSFDRRMSEEINRLLIDAISDYLFVSEPIGLENLRREGIPDNKVFFVGGQRQDRFDRFGWDLRGNYDLKSSLHNLKGKYRAPHNGRSWDKCSGRHRSRWHPGRFSTSNDE